MKRLIGQRLSAELERKGWDAADLARVSGVNPGVISRHMNNKRAPRIETAERYAQALNIPIQSLLEAEGEDSANLHIGARILSEHDARKLTPNAQLAVDNYDWYLTSVREEQAVISMLSVVRLFSDEDPPVEFWESKIRDLLRFVDTQ